MIIFTYMHEVVASAEKLGARIRAERKRQGITQQTLADLSNVSVHFLSNLENGKATSELRGCLAVLHALGIDVVLRGRGDVEAR